MRLDSHQRFSGRPLWQRTLISCAALHRHWDTEREQHWLSIYAQGLSQFIVIRGILVYATIMCVPLIILALQMSIRGQLSVSPEKAVITTLLLSIIGGIIFGLSAWFGTLFSYQQYLHYKKAPQSGAN